MSQRRDFLRTITLASGAVFLGLPSGCGRQSDDVRRLTTGAQRFLHAHDFLRNGKRAPDVSRVTSTNVCVVGAGFAGVTAAWLLGKHGIDCTLLETESVVGGCARTYAPPSSQANVPLGNVYFVERTNVLDGMAKQAGVLIEPCPDDIYVIGDRIISDLWSDSDIRSIAHSGRDAEGMKRFRDELLGMSDDELPLYPVRIAENTILRRFDGTAAEDFVRAYHSPTLEMVLDAYARSSMGAGLKEINTYCLLNFYVDEFGASFNKGRWIVQGGTSGLLAGIAGTLDDVRTDRLVYQVERRADGWSVYISTASGHSERIDAQHVILATPLFVTRALLRRSGLAEYAAIPSLQYAPYMTVHMHSNEMLTPAGSYDTWHLPAGERYTDLISTGSVALPPGHRGVWTGAYSPLPEHTRGRLLDEQYVATIANQTADAVARRLGKEPEVIDEIYAWTWGHGVVIPSVGSHQSVRECAKSMPSGLHLACTDLDAAPSIENAIMAAEYAVSRIVK